MTPLRDRVRAAAVRWGPTLVRVLPVVLLGLMLAGDAAARVGGGHSYGGGSRSSGRSGGFSGGGSSGGGGDGDLIFFLIWLCIEHPMIGIPAVLVIAGFVVFRVQMQGGGRGPMRTIQRTPAPPPRPQSQGDLVKRVDPNFSEPLLIDFFQLVYVRGRTTPRSAPDTLLVPYFSASALEELARSRGADGARDVIFGMTKLETARIDKQWTRLTLFVECNLTLTTKGGGESQRIRQERWTLRRRTGVLSPGPERMRSLSCPACGSTLEPSKKGRCPNCDSVRTGGEIQWEVVKLLVVHDRPLTAPELHLGGGVEPGTRDPSVVAPDLAAKHRALVSRHPDWNDAAFRDRVRTVFGKLQAAWSAGKWETARPYQTDALFQVHRYWMERYATAGLRNKLDEIEVLKVDIVKVDQDAWYESITVRLWARMLDWTEDRAGKVVGGSKREARTFSEYWTFLRAVGAEQREQPHDLDHCPSCGAPLDQVSMAGVCGYCDSKITGGDFDWVLSRIEQDDSYAG